MPFFLKLEEIRLPQWNIYLAFQRVHINTFFFYLYGKQIFFVLSMRTLKNEEILFPSREKCGMMNIVISKCLHFSNSSSVFI